MRATTIPCSIGIALLHAELAHDVLEPVGAEDPHQVVLERQVETRGARIALAAARPRSWLSMRRDSWRSVPTMKRPPAARTFSLFAAGLSA